MSVSMRAQLTKIGEPRPGGTLPAFPSGFHSAPKSLRAALRAMNSPEPEKWIEAAPAEEWNDSWCEDCEGLATDGVSWYVVSNKEGARAIRKFSKDFSKELVPVALCPEDHHVGSPDHYQDRVYVPIEREENRAPAVWVLDSNLETIGVYSLAQPPSMMLPPTRDKMPWCAINPWNGFLYTSADFNVTAVFPFDPNDGFRSMPPLTLGGPPVQGVQAGRFSDNGHLYLASDQFIAKLLAHKGVHFPPASKDIRAYSVLNGEFLGSCPISYNSDLYPGNMEEMQSVALFRWATSVVSDVQVLILDIDIGGDDVYLKHYVVPRPEFL